MTGDPLTWHLATEFTVMSRPTGKQRPFVTKAGVAFTPQKTVNVEQSVRDAWLGSGGVVVEGPVGLLVTAFHERPKGHYTPKGSLSAKGKREPVPTVHPDWDNIGKLVADALNGYAWRDDRAITDGAVKKRWADADTFPRVEVQIFSANNFAKVSVDSSGETTVTFQV